MSLELCELLLSQHVATDSTCSAAKSRSKIHSFQKLKTAQCDEGVVPNYTLLKLFTGQTTLDTVYKDHHPSRDTTR